MPCRPCCINLAAKEGEAAEKSEAEKKQEEAAQAYTKFYASFGKSLKMGLIEDQSNR
jgi:HSP90 family molecular chaperone